MSTRENTEPTPEYGALIEMFLSETDRRSETKSAQMTFRLKPSELAELKDVARHFGVEPSRFSRRLVLIGLLIAKRQVKAEHTNHV